jgi:hypothetical protein
MPMAEAVIRTTSFVIPTFAIFGERGDSSPWRLNAPQALIYTCTSGFACGFMGSFAGGFQARQAHSGMVPEAGFDGT